MAGFPCIAAMDFSIQTLNITIRNTTLSAIAHCLAKQSAIISYTLTMAMLIPDKLLLLLQ
ncbi:hypothetical protein HVX32_21355 [Escherichia coli]|nr:hypothetical protein HVX32_21355 [Escherichia coli]